MKHLTDERQTKLIHKAAWVSLAVMLVTYFSIELIEAFSGGYVPVFDQLVVMFPLAMAFLILVKQDGYHFRIPSIPETNTSVQQPAAIRSVPWLLMVLLILDVVFSPIIQIYIHHLYPTPRQDLFSSLLNGLSISQTALYTVMLTYFGIIYLKRGNLIAMLLILVSGLSGVILPICSVVQNYVKQVHFSDTISYAISSNGSDAYVINSPILMLNFLIWVWIVYVMLRYFKPIIQEGRAYKQELRGGHGENGVVDPLQKPGLFILFGCYWLFTMIPYQPGYAAVARFDYVPLIFATISFVWAYKLYLKSKATR